MVNGFGSIAEGAHLIKRMVRDRCEFALVEPPQDDWCESSNDGQVDLVELESIDSATSQASNCPSSIFSRPILTIVARPATFCCTLRPQSVGEFRKVQDQSPVPGGGAGAVPVVVTEFKCSRGNVGLTA